MTSTTQVHRRQALRWLLALAAPLLVAFNCGDSRFFIHNETSEDILEVNLRLGADLPWEPGLLRGEPARIPPGSSQGFDVAGCERYNARVLLSNSGQCNFRAAYVCDGWDWVISDDDLDDCGPVEPLPTCHVAVTVDDEPVNGTTIQADAGSIVRLTAEDCFEADRYSWTWGEFDGEVSDAASHTLEASEDVTLSLWIYDSDELVVATFRFSITVNQPPLLATIVISDISPGPNQPLLLSLVTTWDLEIVPLTDAYPEVKTVDWTFYETEGGLPTTEWLRLEGETTATLNLHTSDFRSERYHVTAFSRGATGETLSASTGQFEVQP